MRFSLSSQLISEADKAFLRDLVLSMDEDWPAFLEHQAEAAPRTVVTKGISGPAKAGKMLQELGLRSENAQQILSNAAKVFFDKQRITIGDCVRLTHIFAALDLPVPENFRFVCRDNYLRGISDSWRLVADLWSDMDLFADDEWINKHVLHEDYGVSAVGSFGNTWERWVRSKSPLKVFMEPEPKERDSTWQEDRVIRFLRAHGTHERISFPYPNHRVALDDYDFAEIHWKCWRNRANDDSHFWCSLLERILKCPVDSWTNMLYGNACQHGPFGHVRRITYARPYASWIMKLRDLPCIKDTRGIPRKPSTLLCRTEATQPFIDVEPFVHPHQDTEAARPLLLALGVSDKPVGPQRIIGRIEGLAASKAPLPDKYVGEVQQLYERLDQLYRHSDYSCKSEISQALTARGRTLILTDQRTWAGPLDVFLDPKAVELPGIQRIHPAFSDLALWRAVGIQDRPSPESAIQWLKSLKLESKLTPDEMGRVRFIQGRYPDRVWEECGVWLNLQGTLVPVDELRYKLTMQYLVSWKKLFDKVKRTVADLQELSATISEAAPFNRLTSLGQCLELRVCNPNAPLTAPGIQDKWIIALGDCFSRVKLEGEQETGRVRDHGSRLKRTSRYSVPKLEAQPCLKNGEPAGEPHELPALWFEDSLYVKQGSRGQTAESVARELSRVFGGRYSLADAIRMCVDRDPIFIDDYFTDNFTLTPVSEARDDDGGREDTRLPEPNPETGVLCPVQTEDEGFEASDGDNGDESPAPTGIELPDEDEPGVSDGKSKRQRRDLFAEWAVGLGFTFDHSRNFYKSPQGGFITKSQDAPFQWERREGGRVTHWYWVRDHCLEEKPLEIDVLVWKQLEKQPEAHTLVLKGNDEKPRPYSGIEIMALKERNMLLLNASKYLLTLNGDHDE